MQRDQIAETLIHDRQLRLGQTFAQYGSTRLPDSFWEEEIIEWTFPVHAQKGRYLERQPDLHCTIGDILPRNRTLLKKALRRTYAARSGYVHEGRREIDFIADISATAGGVDKNKPLPFKILRRLVRQLIEVELRERGRPVQLPDIRLTS